MTIGLILLTVVAVFLFFGGTERFFARLGLPSKAAFLIVLALVLGSIIPQIGFKNLFSINMGGFLIPLAVMTVFFIRCNGSEERMKALISVFSVAAVCIAVRMLIPARSAGLTVTISVVTGFVGAAVACIVSPSRVSALAGVLGGVVLGDVVTSLMYRFFIDGSMVELGTAGAFDSVIIGVIFTVIIAEVLGVVKKHSRKHKAGQPVSMPSDLGLESAQDIIGEISDPPVFHFNEEDYEEYFNDDID